MGFRGFNANSLELTGVDWTQISPRGTIHDLLYPHFATTDTILTLYNSRGLRTLQAEGGSEIISLYPGQWEEPSLLRGGIQISLSWASHHDTRCVKVSWRLCWGVGGASALAQQVFSWHCFQKTMFGLPRSVDLLLVVVHQSLVPRGVSASLLSCESPHSVLPQTRVTFVHEFFHTLEASFGVGPMHAWFPENRDKVCRCSNRWCLLPMLPGAHFLWGFIFFLSRYRVVLPRD